MGKPREYKFNVYKKAPTIRYQVSIGSEAFNQNDYISMVTVEKSAYDKAVSCLKRIGSPEPDFFEGRIVARETLEELGELECRKIKKQESPEVSETNSRVSQDQ